MMYLKGCTEGPFLFATNGLFSSCYVLYTPMLCSSSLAVYCTKGFKLFEAKVST